jgi:hypothetical protein
MAEPVQPLGREAFAGVLTCATLGGTGEGDLAGAGMVDGPRAATAIGADGCGVGTFCAFPPYGSLRRWGMA